MSDVRTISTKPASASDDVPDSQVQRSPLLPPGKIRRLSKAMLVSHYRSTVEKLTSKKDQ